VYYNEESKTFHEVVNVPLIVNINFIHKDTYDDVICSADNGINPIDLIAQVSYRDGYANTSWIIDSVSTHHMIRFKN